MERTTADQMMLCFQRLLVLIISLMMTTQAIFLSQCCYYGETYLMQNFAYPSYNSPSSYSPMIIWYPEALKYVYRRNKNQDNEANINYPVENQLNMKVDEPQPLNNAERRGYYAGSLPVPPPREHSEAWEGNYDVQRKSLAPGISQLPRKVYKLGALPPSGPPPDVHSPGVPDFSPSDNDDDK